MGMQSKNFSDLVTFTRASGGTSFRPVGRGALVNQVLASSDVSNTSWTTGKSAGATVGALTTGPDGQQSARLVTYSTGGEYLYQGFTSYPAVTGQTVTMAMVCNTATRAGGWGGGSPSGTDVFAAYDMGGGFWLQTITRTFTVTTSANTLQPLPGSGFGLGAATVAYYRIGVFTGTVTAQQILDNGGIPLTFSAADNVVRIDTPGDPIQLFTVPANYPRRDYDPVTGVCKGLLVEEQRTNLITYSNDLSGSSWTKSAVTQTPNAALAPDGTMTATKVVAPVSASDVYHDAYASWTVVTGSAYTYSRYVKTAGYTKVRIADLSNGRFSASLDLITGQVSNTGGQAFVSASMSQLSDGWWRLSVTVNTNLSGVSALGAIGYPDTGATLTSWGVTYAGDGVSGVLVWGAQMEAGAFPTSYIPTSGAAATRAGDVPVVNTLSPWFNATEGTLAVDFTHTNTDNWDRLVFSLQSTSWINNAMHMRNYGSSMTIAGYNGATQEIGLGFGLITPGDKKVAFAYATNNFAGSLNGSTPIQDTSGTVPPVSTLMIGTNGTAQQRNGHIKRIQYIPKRLSDAKLQALTTLTYGEPYGPELATGWAASGVGVAVSGQSVVLTNASPSAGVGIAGGQLVATKTYVMTMTISGFSSDVGGISFCSGGMNGAGIGAIYTANGTFTQTITAATTETFGIRARNSNVTATVTCSVREATAQ